MTGAPPKLHDNRVKATGTYAPDGTRIHNSFRISCDGGNEFGVWRSNWHYDLCDDCARKAGWLW